MDWARERWGAPSWQEPEVKRTTQWEESVLYTHWPLSHHLSSCLEMEKVEEKMLVKFEVLLTLFVGTEN